MVLVHLNNLLFRTHQVTGYHNSWGNVAMFALELFLVNLRMARGPKEIIGSMESNLAMVGISGLTLPNKYPVLSDDWKHVLHDPNSEAYNVLKSDLLELASTIDERNKIRRYVNLDYHPSHCAISIFG